MYIHTPSIFSFCTSGGEFPFRYFRLTYKVIVSSSPMSTWTSLCFSKLFSGETQQYRVRLYDFRELGENRGGKNRSWMAGGEEIEPQYSCWHVNIQSIQHISPCLHPVSYISTWFCLLSIASVSLSPAVCTRTPFWVSADITLCHSTWKITSNYRTPPGKHR